MEVQKAKVKTKVTHNAIDLNKKVKILKAIDSGKSDGYVAAVNGISKKSVRDIKQDRLSTEWALSKGRKKTTKRLRPGKYEDVENELAEWIENVRGIYKLPVSTKLAKVCYSLLIFNLFIYRKRQRNSQTKWDIRNSKRVMVGLRSSKND